jgi:hypothetical protein
MDKYRYERKPTYKVGDKVRCIPGLGDKVGLGYIDSASFTISSVAQHSDYSIVYFFEEVTSGVWENALEYDKQTLRNDKLNLLGI